VGRISDIFGRRWIFIGGAALGVIGSIVSATAQSISTLIGGMTLIGISASTQLSYYYVMGELVPMRYRLAGNSFVYIFQLPGTGVAPVIANCFILYHPSVGWRGCYYILIAVNTLALICWVLFYHPPTFHMKHGNDRMIKYIKEFDYVGTVLYTGGLVSILSKTPDFYSYLQLIFVMGLNWGGNAYEWSSAHVITAIVVGFFALVAFVLWKCFVPLREPLVNMHFFRNRGWVAATIISGLCASIFYAFAIVWPQMVGIMYGASSGPMGAAWLSSLVGMTIVLGEIVGGFSAKAIRHLKYQCMASMVIGGILFACTSTSAFSSPN
jgi:MFS family permease